MKMRSIEKIVRSTSVAVFLIFFGLELFAQVPKTKYYDKDGLEVDSISSYYYEITNFSPEYDWVSYYTKTGKLREKRVTLNSKDFQHGVKYYENGNKMWEGDSYKYSSLGTIKSYYRNGFEKSELFFDSTKSAKHRRRVINYKDSLGNVLVENGSGMCKRCELEVFSNKPYFETGKIVNGLKSGEWTGVNMKSDVTYSETYNEGILISGIQNYEGQNYTYTELETQAVPANGIQEVYRLIGQKIRYPKSARRHGIEGKVFVQFVVDKEGNIIDTKVIKGIDPECDNEALKAVKSLPKWTPGYQRGKPVKQRFTLPIQFKLG
ncbi:MAG: energy transducer TonB [Cyclobacteriaceae bacterium]|nr:energy transducer TonB [Cyclobacteriaceae bacterium]